MLLYAKRLNGNKVFGEYSKFAFDLREKQDGNYDDTKNYLHLYSGGLYLQDQLKIKKILVI